MSEIENFEKIINKTVNDVTQKISVYADLNQGYFGVFLKKIESKIMQKALHEKNIFSDEIYSTILTQLIKDKDFNTFKISDLDFYNTTGKEMIEIIIETYFHEKIVKSYYEQIYHSIEDFFKSKEIKNLYLSFYNELKKISQEIHFPNNAAKWLADIRDSGEQIDKGEYAFTDSMLTSARFLKVYSEIRKNENVIRFLSNPEIINAVNASALWSDMLKNYKPYMNVTKEDIIMKI